MASEFQCWRCGCRINGLYYTVYLDVYEMTGRRMHAHLRMHTFLCPECYRFLTREIAKYIEKKWKNKTRNEKEKK